jgi:hypothetical protein
MTDLIQMANEQNQTAKGYNYAAGGAGLGSVFSNFAASMIDYSTLRTDSASLYVQAGEVQLQAKQRANQLREQFINAASSYMFGAAQRGIAVQSGSVKSNLEHSAGNLGKDIDTMGKNAKLKALQLATQANIARDKAKGMRLAAYTNAINGTVSSIASAMSSAG